MVPVDPPSHLSSEGRGIFLKPGKGRGQPLQARETIVVPNSPVGHIGASQTMTFGLAQIAPVPDPLVPGMEVFVLDLQPTPEAYHDAKDPSGVGLWVVAPPHRQAGLVLQAL